MSIRLWRGWELVIRLEKWVPLPSFNDPKEDGGLTFAVKRGGVSSRLIGRR